MKKILLVFVWSLIVVVKMAPINDGAADFEQDQLNLIQKYDDAIDEGNAKDFNKYYNRTNGDFSQQLAESLKSTTTTTVKGLTVNTSAATTVLPNPSRDETTIADEMTKLATEELISETTEMFTTTVLPNPSKSSLGQIFESLENSYTTQTQTQMDAETTTTTATTEPKIDESVTSVNLQTTLSSELHPLENDVKELFTVDDFLTTTLTASTDTEALATATATTTRTYRENEFDDKENIEERTPRAFHTTQAPIEATKHQTYPVEDIDRAESMLQQRSLLYDQEQMLELDVLTTASTINPKADTNDSITTTATTPTSATILPTDGNTEKFMSEATTLTANSTTNTVMDEEATTTTIPAYSSNYTQGNIEDKITTTTTTTTTTTRTTTSQQWANTENSVADVTILSRTETEHSSSTELPKKSGYHDYTTESIKQQLMLGQETTATTTTTTTAPTTTPTTATPTTTKTITTTLPTTTPTTTTPTTTLTTIPTAATTATTTSTTTPTIRTTTPTTAPTTTPITTTRSGLSGGEGTTLALNNAVDAQPHTSVFPPPMPTHRLAHSRSLDGVEVFYGYSLVKHN